MRKILGRTIMVIAPLIAAYAMIQNMGPFMIAIAEPGEANGAFLRFFMDSALWVLGSFVLMVLGVFVATSGKRH